MKDTRNVLIVASTASMIKQFNLRNITLLKRLGYRVFVATNFAEPGTITAEMAQKLMIWKIMMLLLFKWILVGHQGQLNQT